MHGAFIVHLRRFRLEPVLPWLRRLVVGLSPRRIGFAAGSVRVGFVMEKVALGQVLQLFPCQYYSITALNTYLSRGGRINGTLVLAVGRHNLILIGMNNNKYHTVNSRF
jgi:hypothetical protein